MTMTKTTTKFDPGTIVQFFVLSFLFLSVLISFLAFTLKTHRSVFSLRDNLAVVNKQGELITLPAGSEVLLGMETNGEDFFAGEDFVVITPSGKQHMIRKGDILLLPKYATEGGLDSGGN